LASAETACLKHRSISCQFSFAERLTVLPCCALSAHSLSVQLVLHHYVLKSKAEFATKSARGSGAGNVKTWGYWDYIEGLCTGNCSGGVAVSKAFMASQPRLKHVAAPGHFCSHSVQHSAAERLKAAAAGVLAKEEHGTPSQWNGQGVKAAAAAPSGQDVADILEGGDSELYNLD
jgi:hypothetical protein